MLCVSLGAASCSVLLCHECTTASVVGSRVSAVNVSVPLLVHCAMCCCQRSAFLLCCFPVTLMCCVCVTASAVCRAGATISPLMYYYFCFFLSFYPFPLVGNVSTGSSIITVGTYLFFPFQVQVFPCLCTIRKASRFIEVHSTIKLFSHPSIHSQNYSIDKSLTLNSTPFYNWQLGTLYNLPIHTSINRWRWISSSSSRNL